VSCSAFYIVLYLLSLCCQFALCACFLANSALSSMGVFPCSLLKCKFVVFLCFFILSYPLLNRSNQLRHLRLVGCDNISKGSLAAVAKNFPLLEELHIYLTSISIVDIEVIGRSCSQLKSFTLNVCGFRGGLTGFRRLQINVDDQDHAIALNMPELQHLALFGNTMTNEGLCAILDGCPLLESLDLRHCYSIDLEGDVGMRCRQQIIELKCPHDCTHGYELSAQICDYMDLQCSE